MNREQETQIIRTLLEHHGRGESRKAGDMATVSVDVYHSAAIHDLERDILFRRHPQCVGLSKDLPGPGSYCARSDLAVPTVLTRDGDGVARAFANVCRHRGSLVASGRGEARRLSCPYHAWTYGLDGSLLGVPDASSFPDLDRDACALLELPLVEHGGMLWLLPPGAGDGEPTTDVGDYLGTMDAELADMKLGSFDHWRSERMELELNWKLVIETFLEPYHFASLHRATVGPYFLPNLCWVDGSPPHTREILPRRTLLELAAMAPDHWELLPHAVIVHVLFPNTVLVWLLDHIETWRVTPHATDPGRCVCELDFYLPADNTRTQEYWEKNWVQTINTVLIEDFPAMAGVQRGVGTGVNTHFHIGRNEPALAQFQQAISDALATASPSGTQR